MNSENLEKLLKTQYKNTFDCEVYGDCELNEYEMTGSELVETFLLITEEIEKVKQNFNCGKENKGFLVKKKMKLKGFNEFEVVVEMKTNGGNKKC